MNAIIGNGIYSTAEAARLLGISSQRVNAWFQGWRNGRRPLLDSDYARLCDGKAISFLDLIDAAVSATLLQKHGVSHHMIRRLRRKLAKLWNTSHPFAREEFYTDESGRQVFYTLATDEDAAQVQLIEILDQQHAIPQVLLPFLSRVEYSSDTRFAQLLPLMGEVVLDPRRKYGKPTVRGTGMATSILHDCFVATESEQVVADWYGVTEDEVLEAVTFETEFRGIAA